MAFAGVITQIVSWPKTYYNACIAIWFKSGLGLREIELRSGTKWTSSLEKYKPVDRDALLKSVMMFHPMG